MTTKKRGMRQRKLPEGEEPATIYVRTTRAVRDSLAALAASHGSSIGWEGEQAIKVYVGARAAKGGSS